MAGRLVWSRLQAVRILTRQPVRQPRRFAHQQKQGNGESNFNTWLIGAAAAATAIATYQVSLWELDVCRYVAVNI